MAINSPLQREQNQVGFQGELRDSSMTYEMRCQYMSAVGIGDQQAVKGPWPVLPLLSLVFGSFSQAGGAKGSLWMAEGK